ncbi:DNA topoisomerase IB [Scleromatobacter humisilvae]|uniref:DNA topoisomerase IB n=1 Tax=Scleromatobacter humisilvae TaxID=2897159 RepID=UPI003084615A
MTRTPAARRRHQPSAQPAHVADAPETVPAGLVWVSDAEPGLRRVKRGDLVHYLDAAGKRVRDEAVLARIRKLAIPPAYEQVWICAQANGHLQATGRDARGRKQYRYHPQWQQQRGDDKFEAMRAFGAALPRIRRCVQRDLAAHDGRRPTRTLVLATLVRLLDTTFIRIGNEEYARGNGSYGLTTLRTRHAGVREGELRLSFKGKSGVRHEVTLSDRRVAAVVRRCKALPGQELFQYADDEGGLHKVTSADVNDYLSEIAGARVTAKDFRTWHGSVLALEFTRAACAGERVPGAAKQVIAQVAARLRNTVAVCRKSYIHPKVLELGALLGDDEARAALLQQRWTKAAEAARGRALSAAERRLLALLGPLTPRRATRNKSMQRTRADGSGICPTAPDHSVANAPHRKASHAEDLGFHDAQRAGRPPRREPAASRASDG